LQLLQVAGFYLEVMDNEPSNLPESLWRRKLTPSERKDVSTWPELKLEARLTDALSNLADAPLASNFTARVMAEIDREETRSYRAGWRWNWRLLLPRVAAAAAVLFVTGISVQHYEISSNRSALAKSVAMIAVSHPAPSVDALENLDAIQRMGQSGHADGELLADLQ
jgi:negative regulator of sigma E activity